MPSPFCRNCEQLGDTSSCLCLGDPIRVEQISNWIYNHLDTAENPPMTEEFFNSYRLTPWMVTASPEEQMKANQDNWDRLYI